MLRTHRTRYFELDVDARAFINAYGVDRPADIWALDQRCKLYKSNSLWTKMALIYPMVKDIATCKKPLGNPQSIATPSWMNLDSQGSAATYDKATGIYFNGEWWRTNNVVFSNGGTPGQQQLGAGLRQNQTFGFWSTFASTSTNEVDIVASGGAGGAGNLGTLLFARKGNNTGADHQGSSSRALLLSEPDGLGLFACGHNATPVNAVWKNGVSLATGANSGIGSDSLIYLGVNSTSSPSVWSSKKYGLFFFTEAVLTSTDHTNLYTIENYIQSNSRF